MFSMTYFYVIVQQNVPCHQTHTIVIVSFHLPLILFLNEVFQILAPLLTNLVIVIDAIEENLELMMEVYTLLCVEEFVPWCG